MNGRTNINFCGGDAVEFAAPTPEEVARIAAALPGRNAAGERKRTGREALIAAAERVARLNPDAEEIGAGMLRTIINEARDALAVAWLEDQ